MDKLVVDKMRDTIVIEKTKGNKVYVGSKFYCGCCGGILGVSKKRLIFPFTVNEFNAALKNKTFTSNLFGLHHKTCGHTMFSFKKGYDFIRLEAYIENVP